MAKPMLVTWPLLFLLLDCWPLGRVEKGRKGERERGRKGAGEKGRKGDTDHLSSSPSLLIVEKIPLFLLAAASSTVTFLAQRAAGSVTSLDSVPIFTRIARAAVLYVAYLGETFWPANLAALYPREPLTSYGPALGAAVLLALLTAGALAGARRGQRWLAVGWFWYLVTLAPTIGLIQVGLQVMADRFTYLPQIGLCVALVWGVGRWGRGEGEKGGKGEREQRVMAAVSTLLLSCLMLCAWRQTSYWRDSERLWTRDLACTSNNGIAHNNLGNALFGRGQVDGAIVQYGKALELEPRYVEARINLGHALAGRGRIDEAIAQYGKALELEPDNALAHNDLGSALTDCGKFDEAIAHFQKALDLKPDYAEARNNLGNAMLGCGEVDEAIAQYRKALEIRDDFALAHNNLGSALARRGNFDEAIVHFRKALDINPDLVGVDVRRNLAVALSERQKVLAALAERRALLRARRGTPRC